MSRLDDGVMINPDPVDPQSLCAIRRSSSEWIKSLPSYDSKEEENEDDDAGTNNSIYISNSQGSVSKSSLPGMDTLLSSKSNDKARRQRKRNLDSNSNEIDLAKDICEKRPCRVMNSLYSVNRNVSCSGSTSLITGLKDDKETVIESKCNLANASNISSDSLSMLDSVEDEVDRGLMLLKSLSCDSRDFGVDGCSISRPLPTFTHSNTANAMHPFLLLEMAACRHQTHTHPQLELSSIHREGSSVTGSSSDEQKKLQNSLAEMSVDTNRVEDNLYVSSSLMDQSKSKTRSTRAVDMNSKSLDVSDNLFQEVETCRSLSLNPPRERDKEPDKSQQMKTTESLSISLSDGLGDRLLLSGQSMTTANSLIALHQPNHLIAIDTVLANDHSLDVCKIQCSESEYPNKTPVLTTDMKIRAEKQVICRAPTPRPVDLEVERSMKKLTKRRKSVHSARKETLSSQGMLISSGKEIVLTPSKESSLFIPIQWNNTTQSNSEKMEEESGNKDSGKYCSPLSNESRPDSQSSLTTSTDDPRNDLNFEGNIDVVVVDNPRRIISVRSRTV
eukprot:CAMPEP_0182431074 /NCGR_PEP_ID=MMETSP1167-20130531/46246_1 /TAXON_ID=2988 /ORGANISM="Mallomonas Sp, Strain CCMP3275" /LENGTH=558 /DNA_ID=CAMNT_0024616987 /DNA_START=132 /DNA_END=1809 /DNA_ORIENTATION=-